MPEIAKPSVLVYKDSANRYAVANTAKASALFDDFALIRRSQAGDTEAFGALVVKYQSRLFTMICRMVGDENDAWDLAQEGFVKAWRSIQRFKSCSSFYTWP